MKKLQIWNGTGWQDIAIQELPLGVRTIKVVDESVPALDLDVLTPLRNHAKRKPEPQLRLIQITKKEEK